MNGYVSGYSNGFNFLSAELTAAPAETKFDNIIVGCGLGVGTGVPITTDIIVRLFWRKWIWCWYTINNW